MRLRNLILMMVFTASLCLGIGVMPGHPGGSYVDVLFTVYGSVKIEDWDNSGSAVEGVSAYHVSPDKMSAQAQVFIPTRKFTEVSFDVVDYRDDIDTAYVTVQSQPGVEVSIDSENVFHISPGTYLVKLKKTYRANTTENNTKPNGIPNSTKQRSEAKYKDINNTPVKWCPSKPTGENVTGIGYFNIDHDGDGKTSQIWYAITRNNVTNNFFMYIDKNNDHCLDTTNERINLSQTLEFEINTLNFTIS